MFEIQLSIFVVWSLVSIYKIIIKRNSYGFHATNSKLNRKTFTECCFARRGRPRDKYKFNFVFLLGYNVGNSGYFFFVQSFRNFYQRKSLFVTASDHRSESLAQIHNFVPPHVFFKNIVKLWLRNNFFQFCRIFSIWNTQQQSFVIGNQIIEI